MDGARFDTLTRSLTDARSRRGALAALLGGTVGLLGLADTVAKKKGKGKNKKRKKNPSLPPPPEPTCSDGVTNGSETDVDCGGTCPRCAVGKTCASRNDCASALCTGGTCQTCTSSGQCGTEADGSSCPCRPPVAGGPNFCTKGNAAGPTVTNCELCPTGTICVGPVPGGFNCTKHCGAP